MRLKAIILDMDGLMFDTERIAQLAWQQAASSYGYEFSPEKYTGIIGLALPDVEQFTRRTFGADFPFDAIYSRKQKIVEQEISANGIPFKPGLLELLSHTEQAGLQKAVASSSGRPIILHNLEMAGMPAKRFNAIIGGDEIRSGKPAPDIFLAASRLLDLDAGECLVLEDSNAGIKAAQAAGMLSIMVPDMLPPTQETRKYAYQILPDLHAVSRLLFPINER